ncbi:MAG: nitrogen assimilation transcriptional regulator NAC [Alphaproteobacteria bacterium]|nr:nitrogen assimilation transcriptional regulator NAC [Alphaproteobacteria bacterium]
MSVDFRKLRSFVKIVDAGSMLRASSILRIAQPALSSQMASLEAHFRQKLLIRSNQGIRPTEAGLALYRHAQAIQRQLEQAQADVTKSSTGLAGPVSIGLATYSATTTVSVPLLRTISERHPQITLYINESFGHVLSELIMTGRMDIAVIYGSGPIRGVRLEPLFREELVLVAPSRLELAGNGQGSVPIAALDGVKLLLPGTGHYLRRIIDTAFARARVAPHVAAEIESVPTLHAAVAAELGATILPWSAAQAMAGAKTVIRRLTKPAIQAPIALGVSDHLPMSEAAVAVRDILEHLVREHVISAQMLGINRPDPARRRG